MSVLTSKQISDYAKGEVARQVRDIFEDLSDPQRIAEKRLKANRERRITLNQADHGL